MRADVARADRHRAVRAAADGWRSAGAIDDATLRAIASAYPDDRVRLSLGIRILAGLAAIVGGGAMAVLAASLLAPAGAETFFALGLALAFAAATEIQIGRLRRAQAGAEYATAILAVACAAAAWESLIGWSSGAPLLFAGFAIVCAVAAWRWGFALLAGLAAVFALVAMSDRHLGRAAWLVFGVGALPMILRFARSSRWPPAHRKCFEAIGLVFLAGAYVAVNLYSLDHRWVRDFGEGGGNAPGVWARGAAIAGTILMPPIVLYLGVRFRERALLIAGGLFAAASLVTLRQYHPLGPWWLSLVLGGASSLALAIALRRWLAAGPGGERSGFTADPLFEDRRIVAAAQAAATLVAMSPGPRVAAEGSFQGGGGRSGGGGATGGA